MMFGLNMKQLQWIFLNCIATCEYEINNNPSKFYITAGPNLGVGSQEIDLRDSSS